jgi:hypothetical protein
MRRAIVAAALGALALPAPAAAHVRTGRVAVDYEGTVARLPPALAGAVEARLYRADQALGLTALAGHRIAVLGYSGEPFLRLGPDGAFANRASLTAAGVGLVRRGAGWQRLSTRPQLIWHDARVRGVPSGATRRVWAVPLVADGRRAELRGEVTRIGRPPAWPWLAIAAAVAAAAAVLATRRRWRTGAIALGWISAAATVVLAAGFGAGATASGGTWVEAGNELVLVLVGVAFLVFGSRDARALAGGALGLLALAVGLTALPVLLHGVVLSALPGNVARAAAAVALSAGTAAVALGLVVFFDVLEHYEEPASVERYL